MTASDSLRVMADLSTSMEGIDYQGYITGFLKSLGATFSSPLPHDTAGAWWCRNEQVTLRASEVYHIEPHMSPLITQAAAGLDMDDVWHMDMLPSDCGFVVFSEPIVMAEARGRKQPIHAMSWRRGSSFGDNRAGMWLHLYASTRDPSDEVMVDVQARGNITPEHMRRMGNLQLAHMRHVQWEDNVGPAQVTPSAKQLADEEAFIPYAEFSDNPDRLIMSMLLLMGQRIVVHSEAKVDRQAAKAMIRKKLPAKIQVIALRRAFENGGGGDHESQIEWAVRWVVRGHWAWRACGQDHPTAQRYENGWRTRVYIAPYAKQADREDLPWHVSTKIFNLTR